MQTSSITEQTYYRQREKYGRMAPEMATGLKALQLENYRLKKLVANQALDLNILRKAATETVEARTTPAHDSGSTSSVGAAASLGATTLSGVGPGSVNTQRYEPCHRANEEKPLRAIR